MEDHLYGKTSLTGHKCIYHMEGKVHRVTNFTNGFAFTKLLHCKNLLNCSHTTDAKSPY